MVFGKLYVAAPVMPLQSQKPLVFQKQLVPVPYSPDRSHPDPAIIGLASIFSPALEAL